MTKKKNKAATTKVATANIKKGLGFAPLKQAANQLIKKNVDVIGFQEIYDGRVGRLRKHLARKGYGMTVVEGVPIAYDMSRYKLQASNARRLPGGVIPGNSARFGNWVALRDRETGQVTVVANTHLSRQRTGQETRWHNQQVREVGDLMGDLRKRFGNNANYFLTGDFNDGGRLKFGMRDHKGSPIDRIFSNQKFLGDALMQTASDHDTYIARFRNKNMRNRKKGGKNGGGGSGWGDWQHWYDDYKNDGGTPGWGDWQHWYDQDNGLDGGPGTGGGSGGGGNPGPDGYGPGSNGVSAYDLFIDLLEQWGIPVGSDIQQIIKDAMLEGYTPDMIDLLIPDIQDTRSWRARFPGWHDRVKNGYNQLSVQEYLQLENTYHRIMQEAGLPVGFYDDPSDFGKWIAGNVSPDEIQGRVRLAVDAAKSVDPTARNLMARFYGLTTGDIASFFLDQKRALPVIERQYETANVASWAARSGFKVDNIKRYEMLVDDGITAEQAASSYGTIKSLSDTFGSIADRFGDTYGQSEAEQDVFYGKSDKRRKLVAKEVATFSGRSQGATGSARRNDY